MNTHQKKWILKLIYFISDIEQTWTEKTILGNSQNNDVPVEFLKIYLKTWVNLVL